MNNRDEQPNIVKSSKLANPIIVGAADAAEDKYSELETFKSTDHTAPLTEEKADKKKEKENALKKLIVYYSNWIERSTFSNFENNQYSATIETIKQIIQANETLAEDKETDGLISSLKEAIRKHAKSEEPSSIYHYGDSATFITIIENNDNSQQTFDQNQRTPRLTTTSECRRSELNLDANNKIIIEEKLKAIGENQFTLTSQISLPAQLTVEQNKTWIRAAISSFLASAPVSSNTPSFEDGLTGEQLALAVSYCEWLGCGRHIGPMQTLRIFADRFTDRLSEKQIKQLKQNEIIQLDDKLVADLANTIKEKDWITWLNNINQEHPNQLSTDSWQQWHSSNADPRFPTLGKQEREELLHTVNSERTKIIKNPQNPENSVRVFAQLTTDAVPKKQETPSLEIATPNQENKLTP